MSQLIPMTFHKILQSKAYTVIILGTDTKRFAIYTDPTVGENIQTHLTTPDKPRPLTHDLLFSVFEGLDIKPLQIVISDIEDTIYFARLYLEQKKEGKTTYLEIDARPSDCMTLAVMHSIPVFCKKEVFDQVIAIEE